MTQAVPPFGPTQAHRPAARPLQLALAANLQFMISRQDDGRQM